MVTFDVSVPKSKPKVKTIIDAVITINNVVFPPYSILDKTHLPMLSFPKRYLELGFANRRGRLTSKGSLGAKKLPKNINKITRKGNNVLLFIFINLPFPLSKDRLSNLILY